MPTIVDDFERSSLNYTTSSGSLAITSDRAYSGTRHLDCNSTEYSTAYSDTGLSAYPSPGDEYRTWHYLHNTEGENECFFAAQPGSSEGYSVYLNAYNGYFSIEYNKGNGFTEGAGMSVDYTNLTGTWFEVGLAWGTDGQMVATIYDPSDGSVYAEVSFTDTAYTDGGIGWGMWPYPETGDGIDYAYLVDQGVQDTATSTANGTPLAASNLTSSRGGVTSASMGTLSSASTLIEETGITVGNASSTSSISLSVGYTASEVAQGTPFSSFQGRISKNGITTGTSNTTSGYSLSILSNAATSAKAATIASTPASITWNIGSDWDAFQSEQNVVHENVGVRSADEVALGYPTKDTIRGGTLHRYLPMDAEQGESIQVALGPSPNVTGTTAGHQGVHGSNARMFDGSDDQMVWYGESWEPPYTVSAYVKPDSLNSTQSFISVGFDYNNSKGSVLQFARDVLQISLGQNYYYGSTSLTAGEWIHVAASIQSDGTIRTTINGNPEHDISPSSPSNGWTNRRVLGSEGWANHFGGKIDEYRVYTSAFSFSELETLYLTSGNHTTSKKS